MTAVAEDVRARLSADTAIGVEAALLVDACLDGEARLLGVLDELADDRRDDTRPVSAASGDDAAPADASRAPRTYLRSVEVQGFRGIGPPSRLDLEPGPGVTLVVGRNGCGKSSFAEALELLLTRTNSRWANRSAVWRSNWRNLHWQGSPGVKVSFLAEGQARPLVVQAVWSDDAGADSAEVAVAGADGSRTLDDLGWTKALETHRPLLPYAELGSIVEGRPSDIYGRMFAVLGLDELTGMLARLSGLRLASAKKGKASATWWRERLGELADVDDERARTCREALASEAADQWDLDAVELVLEGAVDPADGEIRNLRQRAAWQEPDRDALVEPAAARLEAAVAEVRRIEATDAGRSLETADLLDRATRWCRRECSEGDGLRVDGVSCPVCGEGRLGADWLAQAEEQVVRLRKEAALAEAARAELAGARRAARSLLEQPAPPAPATDDDAGARVWAAFLQALLTWNDRAGDLADDALVSRLRGSHQDLVEAAMALRARAAEELARREDAWRPLARNLRAGLDAARRAARAQRELPLLKEAEGWFKRVATELRDERFRPIAEQMASIWSKLREHSSVVLKDVRLAGSATKRRVDLDVRVDDVEGKALGVMSQGEIHALALSMFLPRARAPESPFGFIVIDDPVQAMDPGKVDGLARVLEDVGKSHQVVVFTHDERLPESLRLQQIPARVVGITRRSESRVECRKVRSPVRQYLDDARAVASSDDLPSPAVGKVGSLFCRLAVEAACTELVRRVRLGRGEVHREVEAAIESANTLNQRMALVLFDDPRRAGDVMRHVNERWGRRHADTLGDLNRGTHEGMPPAELLSLVDSTRRLLERLPGR